MNVNNVRLICIGSVVFFASIGILVVAVMRKIQGGPLQGGGLLLGFGSHPGMKKLAEAWGVELANGGINTTRGGHAFRVAYRPGGKNTPSELIFTLSQISCPDVLVRRETEIDAMGKRLGLNREFDFGDTAFDSAFYIESDANDSVLQGIFSSSSRRETLRGMIENGITSIRFSGDGIEAVKKHPTEMDFEAASAESRLEELQSIAKDMSRFDPQFSEQTRWRTGYIVGIGAAVLLGASFFPLMMTHRYGPMDNAPWMWGVLIGLGAWVIIQPLLILILRGHSTSFSHFIPISFILLMAGLLAGASGVVWYNGAWDVSPPTPHETEILDMWTTRSKNSNHYHIAARSWRSEQDRVELSVNSDMYKQAAKGRMMVVTTREGALGWEWIVSKELK